MNEVTKVLSKVAGGDAASSEILLPLVYDELRKLAASRLSREQPGQTLQATALVHEAYVRLVHGELQGDWDSRAHFFAAAAKAMRRILIDSARQKNAQKRGGDWQRVELQEGPHGPSIAPDRLLAIDEALHRLAEEQPEAAELVQQCVFAGLSVEEAGQSLGWSRATAYRHWTYAQAFLTMELNHA